MRQGETQGQKCLLIFRRKLGIPSLGSAAANLHSSYSGGTKSDKTRPIMRLAAYRVEIGTRCFFPVKKQACRDFSNARLNFSLRFLLR